MIELEFSLLPVREYIKRSLAKIDVLTEVVKIQIRDPLEANLFDERPRK
jgi:hypothetical protein